MIPLTEKEIRIILDKINDGKFGWSDDPEIGMIQTKLSIELQIIAEKGRDKDVAINEASA